MPTLCAEQQVWRNQNRNQYSSSWRYKLQACQKTYVWYLLETEECLHISSVPDLRRHSDAVCDAGEGEHDGENDGGDDENDGLDSDAQLVVAARVLPGVGKSIFLVQYQR